jgi:hypothetical protein
MKLLDIMGQVRMTSTKLCKSRDKRTERRTQHSVVLCKCCAGIIAGKK